MSTCFADGFMRHLCRSLIRTLPTLALLSAMVVLPACRSMIDTKSFNSLAKTDIDMIADTSQHELNRLMDELLVKLYKRNPHELDKVSGMTIGQRQNQIFDTPGRLIFKELNKQQGTAALNLAFNPDYQGDRVFALMTGLVGMVRSSYNWLDEQFMFDSLNEQELFNCARNIEVLAWRLSNTRNADSKLLLLSNSQPGEAEDLSYERIFGKMIAIQDMMAFTVAGKWERGINSMVKNAVFLPMGI